MNKELLAVAEAISNEKDISKEDVLFAIQAALESATRKIYDNNINVRVKLDVHTGDYETFRCWEVVADDELQSPELEISLSQALARNPGIKITDHIEELMPSIEFGRIETQAARQVMIQKVRDAERLKIISKYNAKLGHLVYGTVKKVTRDNIIIDLGGKAEAMMPRKEILPNEVFRINDKVRAYLYEISSQARGPQMLSRGPQILLSRIRDEMLSELFRVEVPEIGENIIEIKSVAREPGNRAKIAVKTNDGRIDPVGACVGMRGSRVQAVSSELCGERVDIVLWDDNPAQLVINAMAPAEILSIVVDKDTHTMDLAVQKDQLSQAIGRNGQNVRLASQLTGWTLNVMTMDEFDNKSQQESNKIFELFANTLGVSDDVAQLLIEHGFSSIEEIAYVPKEELLAIEGFDNDSVEELRDLANDVLLTQALTSEVSHTTSSESLMSLSGMTEKLAQALILKGISTAEELAEQSVDELLDIDGMTEKLAGDLIMKARAPWFL